jgi:hypothetical protein
MDQTVDVTIPVEPEAATDKDVDTRHEAGHDESTVRALGISRPSFARAVPLARRDGLLRITLCSSALRVHHPRERDKRTERVSE